jgi:hypothetical protein
LQRLARPISSGRTCFGRGCCHGSVGTLCGSPPHATSAVLGNRFSI